MRANVCVRHRQGIKTFIPLPIAFQIRNFGPPTPDSTDADKNRNGLCPYGPAHASTVAANV